MFDLIVSVNFSYNFVVFCKWNYFCLNRIEECNDILYSKIREFRLSNDFVICG